MSKKPIIIGILAILVLAFGVGAFMCGKNNSRGEVGNTDEQRQEQVMNEKSPIAYIFTFEDLDLKNWNKIETEFFSVKFPREFSWVRPEEPFPYGVITNDLSGVSKWYMNQKNEPSPRKNEISILFNPGLTSQGDPDIAKKSDSEIIQETFDNYMVENQEEGATCQTVSGYSFPTLKCEYETSSEVKHYEYYVANREFNLTVSFYAGTKDERINEIVSQIIQSINLPNPTFLK